MNMARFACEYESYTPLTALKSQILNAIMKEGLIECLPLMKGDCNMRDPEKQCNFHDIRHATKDCFSLKNAIELLVRNGTIKQFVKKRTTCQGSHSIPK